MQNEKKSGGISLTAAIFIIAGVVIAVFGIYSLINGGSKYRGYKKVKAEVIEACYEESTGETAAICVYELNGSRYNYAHAFKKALEVGDTVTLYCNSDKPASPVISRINTGAIAVIAMGAGVAVIGIVILLLSGGKGIGGVSFASLENNASGLINGLEDLMDETYDDEDDEEGSEEEKESTEKRIEAELARLENNAGKLVDGLEAILSDTYEDPVEEPEESPEAEETEIDSSAV